MVERSRWILLRRSCTRMLPLVTAAFMAASVAVAPPAAAAGGDLDPSFGHGGKVVTTGAGSGTSVALQTDGKIVVAGALADTSREPAHGRRSVRDRREPRHLVRRERRGRDPVPHRPRLLGHGQRCGRPDRRQDRGRGSVLLHAGTVRAGPLRHRWRSRPQLRRRWEAPHELRAARDVHGVRERRDDPARRQGDRRRHRSLRDPAAPCSTTGTRSRGTPSTGASTPRSATEDRSEPTSLPAMTTSPTWP